MPHIYVVGRNEDCERIVKVLTLKAKPRKSRRYVLFDYEHTQYPFTQQSFPFKTLRDSNLEVHEAVATIICHNFITKNYLCQAERSK
jgi:hypothetical protein